jgi:hypothetical protein
VLQDSVTLTWQPPADNGSTITFYKLEMDDGRGGDFQHVYGGQAEQLSAVITGLQVSGSTFVQHQKQQHQKL